jgi:multiple sugar transport system permease protein
MSNGDLPHVVTGDTISDRRRTLGRFMVRGAGAFVALLALTQTLHAAGRVDLGFQTWRPMLYAYVTWAIALCLEAG